MPKIIDQADSMGVPPGTPYGVLGMIVDPRTTLASSPSLLSKTIGRVEPTSSAPPASRSLGRSEAQLQFSQRSESSVRTPIVPSSSQETVNTLDPLRQGDYKIELRAAPTDSSLTSQFSAGLIPVGETVVEDQWAGCSGFCPPNPTAGLIEEREVLHHTDVCDYALTTADARKKLEDRLVSEDVTRILDAIMYVDKLPGEEWWFYKIYQVRIFVQWRQPDPGCPRPECCREWRIEYCWYRIDYAGVCDHVKASKAKKWYSVPHGKPVLVPCAGFPKIQTRCVTG